MFASILVGSYSGDLYTGKLVIKGGFGLIGDLLMRKSSALREQCFPFNANCTNRIPNVSFGVISGGRDDF